MSDYPPLLARLARVESEPPVAVHYGAAADQLVDAWLPGGPGPHPVAALFHGGYWRARYRLDVMNALAAWLRAAGVAAWNVEYRRIGSPGGGWPGTFEDVAAGFDALAEHADRLGIDLTRVAAVGHSAGGHLALWVAARGRLAGHPGSSPRVVPSLAVSLAGVCDLVEAARRRLSAGAAVELLGGEPDELPDVYAHASPLASLPLGVEQLVVHGTADADVPEELSVSYAGAAVAAGDRCELLRLEGVDHFALIDPGSDAWAAVADRLLTRLTVAPGAHSSDRSAQSAG